MVKKKSNFLVIILLYTILTSFNTHKYYMGVFDVAYKKEKKAIQITSRLFIDDVEKALKKKYHKNFYLTTKEETKDANTYLTKYLEEVLAFKVNNKVQKTVFLTKETDGDLLVCYSKITFKDKIKKLQITNKALTEIFSEQQNLLHLDIQSKKETLLFSKDKKEQTINYN
jgi:membrane-associated HD superfamily phosphohydrolase